MGCVPNTSPEVRTLRSFCHRYESSPELDLVELSHNGYAFLSEPVFHQRRVFYFKPSLWLIDDVLTGLGEHDYRLCFNFAPGRLEPAGDQPGGYMYFGTGDQIKCTALLTSGMSAEVYQGQTEPKGGWASFAYSEKVPIPQLIYHKKGTVPIRFLSALYPAGRGAVEVTDREGTDELKLNIECDGRSWQTLLSWDRFEIAKCPGES